MTSKELPQQQPEVELVNTRASNGSFRNHSEDFSEIDGDTTIDSVNGANGASIEVNGANGASEKGYLSSDRLLRCISWCEKLQQSKLFEREKTSQQPGTFSRTQSKSTSKTTIGLVLRGCVISELVPGGPAHCCGELNPGDRILCVDGENVTEETISVKLIANDVPDSVVTLSVSRDLEGPTRDVTLNRAAAGTIGDRVRLFEFFAAQKERAADEERSRVQCQAWLDNILKDLLEAKRASDDQKQNGDPEDCFKSMKQRADALERQNQQQAHVIRELKQDLENKRNIERKLRAELSSCESVRHTLQLALEDAKLSPKNLGMVGQDQRLNDLFVETKIELDKTRDSLRMARLDATQSRAAVLDLEEELAASKDKLERAQVELASQQEHEATMLQTIKDSALRLEKLQQELEEERRKSDQDFRDSLAKDVELSKLREEVGDIKRRYDDLKNQLPSSSDVAETYQASVAELNQRCQGLQKDVNTILMLHKRMYEAICRTDSVRPCGIGVRLRAMADESKPGSESTKVIESVFEGGPASESGKVVCGDVLIKIDGRDVSGLTLDEIREHIVGLPGTSLTLQLRRGTDPEIISVELSRSIGAKPQSIPNLEEQTSEACALASALYESLEKSRNFLEEAEAEKEQLKRSFSLREEEVLKTVSKWAENFQGQQLAKFFKSWVRVVLIDLFHKQIGSIIRKRSNKIIVANVLSKLNMLIEKGRKAVCLNQFIKSNQRRGIGKQFTEWRMFSNFARKLDSIVALNRGRKRIESTKSIFCILAKLLDRDEYCDSLTKTNLLFAKVNRNLSSLIFSSWGRWKSNTRKWKSFRSRSLKLQQRTNKQSSDFVINAWRCWSARRCQLRMKVGRLLCRANRQSCSDYIKCWNVCTRSRSYVYRLVCRKEIEQVNCLIAAALSAFKSYLRKKKRVISGATRVRLLIQRSITVHVFCSWAYLKVRSVWSLKLLSYRSWRTRREYLQNIVSAWRKLVDMKGADEVNDVLRAQSLAQRSSENNFVRQLSQYTERLAALESEVAVVNKNLKSELKKNAELESALSSARDEIGAYSQQVEYLRKQVREAWAVSDAARTDLSAAIKSNDQMRNALFGRMEKETTSFLTDELLQTAKLGLGSPASVYMLKSRTDPSSKRSAEFTDA